MIPIVIPLHPRGGKFRDNTELRYALRSLETHFKDPFEIVIVSKKLPAWMCNAKHLKGGGLKSALKVAAEAYPDGFFWFYDDVCLLKDTTAEEMKITPACKSWSKATTGWSRQLDSIRARLVKEELPAWDYSRPHGPYWFDKSMVDEGFGDWPGMAAKFPWESWILSKREWPRRHGVVKQYYGSFNAEPNPRMSFLNYNDKGNTTQLMDYLHARFSTPSRFEVPNPKYFFIHVPKTAGLSLRQSFGNRLVVADPARHLAWRHAVTQSEWKKKGRLPVAACVREPVSRAISLYNYFRTREFPLEDRPHRVLREMLQFMTLSQFWEKVDIVYIATAIKHFRTQRSFLDGATVDKLLRFETLSSDCAALRQDLGMGDVELDHINQSAAVDRDLSPEAVARIREIYREDYETYYPELL